MEHLANIIYIITLILLIIFNIYIYYSLISTRFGKYPPYVPTSKKRKLIILAKISEELKFAKKTKRMFDAGSGIGDIIIPLAKKFPNHYFFGIEWSFFPYWISKIRSKKLKNAKFIHGNILSQSFNCADIIYCYIVSNFEKTLSDKLVKEINKDCLIITNGHNFSNMKLVDEIKSNDKWLSESIFIHKLK